MAVCGLDRIGWAILRELQRNARISYSELGRRVNLTSPAAAERVRRLEEAGVIEAYRVSLQPAALGLPIEAVVQVAPTGPPEQRRLAADVPAMTEVVECLHVTGPHPYWLRVLARSVEHLENVVLDLNRYGSCIVSLVMSRPIRARALDEPTVNEEREWAS